MTQPMMNIVQLPIENLKERKNNPRTHSKKQIRKIADSIKEFGFVTPILIDDEHTIIAGHGRLQAAKFLKMRTVPTVELSHLTPAQIRAYVIADNKLATLAGWDKELLALEISEIIEIDDVLDLTVTGFEVEDLALLSDTAESKRQLPEIPIIASDKDRQAVSRIGDLWKCGNHLLLCGDALDPESYNALLGEERADVVVTDPPYNVPIKGHVSGLGAHHHAEFVQASGEMSRNQFQRFLSGVCRQLVRFSKPGSLHYIFMDWRSIADLIGAGEEHFSELLNLIVWVKSNGGMGALYRSQHELAALFKNGSRSHKNNVALGSNGRYRTNVWNYPGMTSFGADRDDALAMHPTVKNGDMIADAIRDVTDKNDIVLDPFGGSGTTLIAAEQTGRRARLIELDPYYCDCILRRAQLVGLKPKLMPAEIDFEEISQSRMSLADITKTDAIDTADGNTAASYLALVN